MQTRTNTANQTTTDAIEVAGAHGDFTAGTLADRRVSPNKKARIVTAFLK